MLSVAICDDEPLVRKEIADLTAAYFARTDIDGHLTEFPDGETLVSAYKNGTADFQIVFLDIKMQGLNGISAAKQLREYDENALIVFITSSAEYVFRGYEVKAFRYILKTELQHAFRKVLEECVAELAAAPQKMFTFHADTRDITVYLADILYFESSRRQITVHLKNEEYTFYGKLDALEKDLADRDFVRCHQSFLVNAKQIKSVQSDALTLRSGEALPVSRSRREAVRKASLWAMR
ncbi:MAG: LytR/AlgR family response regulator transcription factor [Candidatus Fimenecus sp.]